MQWRGTAKCEVKILSAVANKQWPEMTHGISPGSEKKSHCLYSVHAWCSPASGWCFAPLLPFVVWTWMDLVREQPLWCVGVNGLAGLSAWKQVSGGHCSWCRTCGCSYVAVVTDLSVQCKQPRGNVDMWWHTQHRLNYRWRSHWYNREHYWALWSKYPC